MTIGKESIEEEVNERYLPQVFALVRDGAGAAEIAEHLLNVAKNSIGVGADVTKANQIADILIEHREWLDEMRD